MLESLVVEPLEASTDVTRLDDADLVRVIAAAPDGQSRDAEEELYKRLAPRVRLYGLRHLRDEQASADLAQQVLLVTLEALRAGRLRDPDKLIPFVLGTCRMTVLDIRRNAQRRQQLLDRFARDFPLTSSPTTFIDHDGLTRCLEALPERDRSVVVLTFYDDQTGDDIASFLSVSLENVRVIRHRALERLRKCMTTRSMT